MESRITIDFETRGVIDLLKAGPWKYAAHNKTSIICLAVKENGLPPWIWLPEWVRVLTPFYKSESGAYLRHVINKADSIEAHNFEFERAIWYHIMHKKYGFKDLDLDKCYCSAAGAAYMALPRKLEKVCAVLKTSEKKSSEGHTLMLKMCKPRNPLKAEKLENDNWENTLYWHEKPEQIDALCEYCKQDVEAEYSLSKVLKPLPKIEREIWKLDQEINKRGLPVDVNIIQGIFNTINAYEKKLLVDIFDLTSGAVNSPRQVAALKSWMASKKVITQNLQKPIVDELLRSKLPDDVRQALLIRRSLGKASSSKFSSMLERVSSDGRCRSLFMYSAAGTHRWGGKSIQPQNMVRDSLKGDDLENAYKLFSIEDIDSLEMLYGDPFHTASRCLRGVIRAIRGYKFVCADYASIEARGNAWFAGEEEVLNAFRNNIDLYKKAAAGTFGVNYEDVTDDQRRIGKVQILALGYQGGIGAFAMLAKGYGINLEDLAEFVMPYANDDELEGPYGAVEMAKGYLKRNPGDMSLEAAIACDILKQKWRKDNSNIRSSWGELSKTSMKAVRYPGENFTFRGVIYKTWKDSNSNNYLLCGLPSGRILYYFDPQIRNIEATWGERVDTVTCCTINSVTHQWVRRPLYGGLLCENIIQSFCRDLLAEALLRVEKARYKVVMHVHDEIVAEVPENFGSLEEFCKIMEIVPDWAKGMPIKAEGWEGIRFRK